MNMQRFTGRAAHGPLILISFALSAITGCSSSASATAELPVPKVTTAEVVQHETTDYDDYTGRTEASEVVEIRARVLGYLRSIEFKDGDFVKEVQTLFTIEPDEYEAIHNQSKLFVEPWKSKHDEATTIGITIHNTLSLAKIDRNAKCIATIKSIIDGASWIVLCLINLTVSLLFHQKTLFLRQI